MAMHDLTMTYLRSQPFASVALILHFLFELQVRLASTPKRWSDSHHLWVSWTSRPSPAYIEASTCAASRRHLIFSFAPGPLDLYSRPVSSPVHTHLIRPSRYVIIRVTKKFDIAKSIGSILRCKRSILPNFVLAGSVGFVSISSVEFGHAQLASELNDFLQTGAFRWAAVGGEHVHDL